MTEIYSFVEESCCSKGRQKYPESKKLEQQLRSSKYKQINHVGCQHAQGHCYEPNDGPKETVDFILYWTYLFRVRVCLGGIPLGMSFKNKSLFKVIVLPILGDISETCIFFIWELFVVIYQDLFVE